MRKTRLLVVLTSPVRGGVEEVVLGLLQRLDPSEFQLALAAPPALLDALAPDLAGVAVDTLGVEAQSVLHRRELGRLARFIQRLRPHVVNPHLFRSTLVAAPLARWCGARAVVETYHGREGWRRGPVRGRFLPDRAIARLLDRVIAVSEAARAFLIEAKGYPPDRIVVVPNGRDLSVYRPGEDRETIRRALDVDPTAPLVGVVGRLEAQKGHAYLFEAWPDVRRAFPDARLLVVGDGSLRADLEARARAPALRGSVVFTGFRPDVPRVLGALDVLALPSLYEGMPLTAIEASAMAVPVVATAVDGTPEVVRDGDTGRLVPPADPAALAHALRALLADPARARAMGRAGRAHVLARFDVGAHVEATARIYRVAAGVGQRLTA